MQTFMVPPYIYKIYTIYRPFYTIMTLSINWTSTINKWHNQAPHTDGMVLNVPSQILSTCLNMPGRLTMDVISCTGPCRLAG